MSGIHLDCGPQLKACLSGNKPFEPFELDHEFPALGCRTVWLDARRLYGEGYVENMLLLTFRDITERKQEEKARAHLAAIVASSGDAIISKDLNGTIQSWNEGAQRLFGYTSEEIVGQPILRLLPADRHHEEVTILDAISKGERIDYYETVRQRQDGSLIDISLTVSPIRDGNGHIVGASKIARDITEQKMRRRQQHLLYELATSVNYAESLPDLYEKALDVITQCLQTDRASILLYDADDVMRFKAWLNLSDGYRHAVEGHSPWDKHDPAPGPIIISTVAEWQIDTHLKQVIRTEGIEALAFFPLTYAGRLLGKFMVYFKRPYTMSQDEFSLAQAIARTVSLGIERKQAEHTLRESEDRLRKLANQLEQSVVERTARLRLLATELSLAEQRERKRLATELHDHLQQLLVLSKLKLGQGRRLAESVPGCLDIIKQADDVLTQALAYTRTLVTELCPPILKEFGLSAAIKWLAEQMLQHHLRVHVEVLSEEPELQEEHAVLLFQSVRELLINSSKYAETGHASVRMRVENDVLLIEVRDAGKGFDMSGMRKLESTAASSKFGLFSIRERMKALEGTLEIESAEGAGTTALLSLPLAKKTPLSSPLLG